MEVVWSNRARKSFLKVLDYLQAEWSDKEVKRFVGITDAHLLLISSGILVGRPAKNRERVFSVLLDKNNRLYYRNSGNKIYLLEFWDTRGNPGKNKFD